jgi:hypothetical protein
MSAYPELHSMSEASVPTTQELEDKSVEGADVSDAEYA